MKIFNECVPCLMRQAYEAAKMATNNLNIQQEILKKCAILISNFTDYNSSPELAYHMHNTVKMLTCNNDPYEDIKKKDILSALKLYPYLKKILNDKNNDLYTALKISAIGNIMDSAIFKDLDVMECIDHQLDIDFTICDIEIFKKDIVKAKTLLILGDNAGEAVFDRIFIESLPENLKVYYATRHAPIINDATLSDAKSAGLDNCSTLISSGCMTPGTVLKDCSDEFMDIFDKADIVISKGQGNYEGLEDYSRKVYFLLKAKCDMIANRFSVPVMSYIFKLSK